MSELNLQEMNKSVEYEIRVINNTSDFLTLDSNFEYQGNIYKSNMLICKGMPICKELRNWDDIVDVYNKNSDELKVRPYYEGSLIRIYYDDNKWNVSTNRCIDAFKSYWRTHISFGQLFKEYIEQKQNIIFSDFLNKLDKNIKYYFLFTSSKVGYVSPSSTDNLYLIFGLNYENEIVSNLCVDGVELFEYKSLDEIQDGFTNKNLNGAILESSNKRYCLFHPLYQKKKDLFGNHKFLGRRLIEMDDNERASVIEMYGQQSQYAKYFEQIHHAKLQFCKLAHATYIQRYIQKNFVEVDSFLHHFVKQIHHMYTQNHKPTYLEDVIVLFNNTNDDSKFLYLRKYLSKEIGGFL